MSPRDTGQRTSRFQSYLVTATLISGVIICLVLSLTFLSTSGVNIPQSAQADTQSESITVSYTPSYDTQYAISAPSNLTLSPSGAATTLSISVQSWSDFPTDRSLYCDLTAVSSLTNGSNSVDMIVKSGDDTVNAGDRVGTFSPSSVASDSSASFAVLTVEHSEKPSVGGTYTGSIVLEVGMVE